MNIKQRTQFKNQLLLTLLKTAGLIALGVLGVFYFSRDIKRGVVESIQKRAQIAAQTSQVENFASLKRDYEKLENYFPALRAALPGREELIVLPSRLEAEARIMNVAQTFVFGEEQEALGDEPRSIVFSLNLTADSEQFSRYLERINLLPYFFNFSQFEMISAQGHNSSSMFFARGKVYISQPAVSGNPQP